MKFSDPLSVTEFLSRVRDYFTNPHRLDGEAMVIEHTGVSSDGAAVILYRQYSGSPLHGLHVDLNRFAEMFEPSDPLTLARIISSDEIADPGGGERLEVDWANDMVGDASGILWRSL